MEHLSNLYVAELLKSEGYVSLENSPHNQVWMVECDKNGSPLVPERGEWVRCDLADGVQRISNLRKTRTLRNAE